jgi:uncharacterized protein YgiM (DUF1202 family)
VASSEKGGKTVSIYDRDWYRGEQKSPYDNRRVSREGAEKIRRMMEGTSPNEPPKVAPKYRFEFAGNPTGNDEKPSNGYDPTYGCGYESSTVKQSGWYRKRSMSMKPLSFIILAVVAGYVIAVGCNVMSINNKLNDKFLTKNGLAISIEVGSRLGLAQALGILGNVLSNTTDTSSVWQDDRFLREVVNVLYDWYAPIKWSPVLGVSKEVGRFFVTNRLNKVIKANTVNAPSFKDYGYAYVKTDALNVRSGPSANNRVVITLRMNTRVQVIGKTGVWWRIRYESIEGYINSEYLADKITSVNKAPRSEVRAVSQQVNEQKPAPDRPVETSSVVREPGYGTTRAHSFQNKYEEAVREYDARMRGVPGNLILPGGETVDEAIRSGRVSGK